MNCPDLGKGGKVRESPETMSEGESTYELMVNAIGRTTHVGLVTVIVHQQPFVQYY